MRLRKLPVVLLPICLMLAACKQGVDDTPVLEYIDAVKSGGETTDLTASLSSHAFSAPAANLTPALLDFHNIGDANFEAAFVPTPAPNTPDLDGLGPVFNNTNCNACHQRDGRGTPPLAGDSFTRLGFNESVLLRISLERTLGECTPAPVNDYCAPIPVPGFGAQLFHRGVFGVRPAAPFTGQADVYVRYELRVVTYPDGTAVNLRQPVYEFRHPYDAPAETPASPAPTSRLLQPDVHTSPRIGPPVFGLGLLAAITEADILSYADPDDANHDGISGRPNEVFDRVKYLAHDPDPLSLGRFGWKANVASLPEQVLGALHGDIGVTNELFPQESIAATALHDDYLTRYPADTGVDTDGTPEADPAFTDPLVFYVESLHVPARRNVESEPVRIGGILFSRLGCAGCHRPKYVTGQHPAGFAALSGQTIFPFTDLLLHDMGEGLADGRSDFQATGREWRTAPLWGIGLTQTVNPQAGFLHDGRARTLEEAILWHGGEADTARTRFMQLSADDRAALLAFLQSL